STIIPLNKDNAQEYILLVTKGGIAVRTKRTVYDLKITRGVRAMQLHERDELLGAKLCDEEDIAVIGTDQGYFAQIFVKDFGVRQSRTSKGMKAFNMKRGGEVVGFDILKQNNNNPELVIITK